METPMPTTEEKGNKEREVLLKLSSVLENAPSFSARRVLTAFHWTTQEIVTQTIAVISTQYGVLFRGLSPAYQVAPFSLDKK